mmetsp:Transcript_23838/g.42233  ORF Transcript_23838/g.42233 Transcript_23838/m.42233 type:complete len:251 (+) Transcript_23838:161-913(+)
MFGYALVFIVPSFGECYSFKPHKCEHCNQTFAYKSRLSEHTFTHAEIRPFSCKQCGLFFKRKMDLKLHFRRSHQMDKFGGLQCSNCTVQFWNQRSLRNHSCGVFRKPLRSRRRVQTLFQETDKVFECEKCNKTFKTLKKYEHHVKPHRCPQEFCNKTFRDFQSLEEHMASHSSIPPYACATCGRNFVYKSALINHKAIHEAIDERQTFTCVECGEILSHKKSIRRHYRILHPHKDIRKEALGGRALYISS